MDSITEKTCGRCKHVRLGTQFYWSKHTGKPYGYCKQCQLEYSREYRAAHLTEVRARGRRYRESGKKLEAAERTRKPLVELSADKQCKKCEAVKPVTEFYGSWTNRDGLGSHCKECDRARVAKYRQEHLAQVLEKDRLYRERALEKRREYNRERYRRLFKKERQPRPRADLAAKREQRRRNHDKRVQRLKVQDGVSKTQWLLLLEWFGSQCLRCGVAEPMTQDHVIPVALGGRDHITNLQPLCLSCNISKHDTIADYRDQATLTGFLFHLRSLTDP